MKMAVWMVLCLKVTYLFNHTFLFIYFLIILLSFTFATSYTYAKILLFSPLSYI